MSYPARAADSANPRVETPAMRMRVISRQPQTPSRRVARHHVQMIEHGAARLANAERLDQLAVRAACEPIRDEGGALRALLRHLGEPVQQPRRGVPAEPPADPLAHRSRMVASVSAMLSTVRLISRIAGLPSR